MLEHDQSKIVPEMVSGLRKPAREKPSAVSANVFRKVFELQNRRVMQKIREKE
jgi:hypothetical protein